MITFVIKSAICLTILYGFYHFFLRNTKAFYFNRFYLLLSSIYAIVISMITIRVGINLPFSLNNLWFSNLTDPIIQGENLISEPIQTLTFPNVLITIYITVSTVLLLRFISNIHKIILLIRTNPKVTGSNTQLVLVDKLTLPFSFFGYVFVNRSDYENGRIENEIYLHENIHCVQYHSIDILLIETIKIILWFNPFIWLFDKAIQLNHEYLADNKVLTNYKLTDYQKTLVNLVFRNNSTYLASHLNYSLTKKRLVMMKKKKSRVEILSILAAIPMFLILGLAIANAQESTKTKTSQLKQADTLSTPLPADHVKVKKAESAEKAATNQKHPVGTGAIIPPPPPPPPPPGKEKMVKKSEKELKEMQYNDQLKNAEEIPPPPPPPPPPTVKEKQLKKSELETKKTQYKSQLKKVDESTAPPPPPPPPPPPVK